MEESQFVKSLKETVLDVASLCRNCNFCQPLCPLHESMEGLLIQSPSGIVQSIYYAIKWNLLDDIGKESIKNILYACTTCNQCVTTCKSTSAGIPVLDAIESGRKLLVELMLGPMKNQKGVLESLTKYGNPYGELPSKRLNWMKNLSKDLRLNEKIITGKGNVENLLYVGCTPSFNNEVQHIASSFVLLLEKLNVDYRLLGEEKCCGDPARRIGDEGLFLSLMEENVRTFNELGVKRIIAISPHCFNTFMSEYPKELKALKLQHYTQFLLEMMELGALNRMKKADTRVTYHDPCYLGRRNGIYEAPRKILNHIAGANFVEMKRIKENSLCCGGGGGRMWIDVDEVKKVAEIRIREALSVGAEFIVTACPWCYLQFRDAIKTSDLENKIQVKDLCELVAECL